MNIAEIHIIKCAFTVKTIIQQLRLCSVLGVCSNFFITSLITMCSIEIYSVQVAICVCLSFSLPVPVLTLPFTVKVCYSYSVCLYNFSVYLYVLIVIIWEISKLQLLEISSWKIFFDFLNLAITDQILLISFRNSVTVTLIFWYDDKQKKKKLFEKNILHA